MQTYSACGAAMSCQQCPKAVGNAIIYASHSRGFHLPAQKCEENKMIFETKKILGCGKIAISATCVRVPVFFCHSESVVFTTKKSTSVNALKQTLSSAPGVALFDNDENFPTTADAEGKDEVFVGRLRQNTNEKNTFSVWIVADNVRKGAATNAVQIAEKLIYFRENVQ